MRCSPIADALAHAPARVAAERLQLAERLGVARRRQAGPARWRRRARRTRRRRPRSAAGARRPRRRRPPRELQVGARAGQVRALGEVARPRRRPPARPGRSGSPRCAARDKSRRLRCPRVSDPSPEPADQPRRGFDGPAATASRRAPTSVRIREAHEEPRGGGGDRRRLPRGRTRDGPARARQGRVPRPRGPHGPHPAAGSLDGLGEERFGALGDLLLGDVIGAEGVAVRSRRGELSLKLTGFELLAPNERPLPDLHHGLADIETRYRQRYLDLMANPEARAVVARARAARHRDPRAASTSAGFIEVETPVLQPLYGGARGAAVHDAPQRARPRRSTCASPRALPQAAASSAAWSASTRSARTSATRASRASTTPSSRCSSCTRPTPTTTT